MACPIRALVPSMLACPRALCLEAFYHTVVLSVHAEERRNSSKN